MSTSQLFSKLARQALWSDKNPSVLPIPAIQSGNNVSFSENKTKRKWQPNVKAHDWPVTILGGEEGRRSKKMPVIRMKTQIGKLREYERAGGVEGILVSTPAKDLSEFGKKMRSAVFYELHRIRDDVLVAAERETGRKGSDPATTEKRVEKPAFLAIGGEEGRKSRRSFQRR